MHIVLICRLAALPALALLATCSGGEPAANLPGGDDTQPFSGIAADETLRFTGTEPFWGGEVTGGRLIYSTMEDQEGREITVERFAGRGGLSFSGTLESNSFDMMVTPGRCSDGMSDRAYPFVVTLRIGEELREGCGWSQKQPFSGSAQP